MAYSEAQVEAILKQNEELGKKLAAFEPALAKVGTLESQNQALQKTVEELKKGTDLNSQELALQQLKTKYPDAPLDVIRKLPAELREDTAKSLQESISKVKAPATTSQSDPMADWTRAGGIGPTDDATIAAETAERSKKLNEAKAKGDVFGMLTTRTADVVAHLKRSFQKV